MALLRPAWRLRELLATRTASCLHSRLFADAASAPGAAEEASTSASTAAGAASEAADHAAAGAENRRAGGQPQGAQPYEPNSYPIRLTGLSPATMRRDVARLFAGKTNVTEYNVKPEYDLQTLQAKAFWVLFDTLEEKQQALRLKSYYVGAHQVYMTVKGRPYMHQVLLCPLAMNSRGRYLLLENVEGTNSLSSVVRHFEGFLLAPHAATLIMPEGKIPLNEYEAISPKTRAEMLQRKPLIRAVVRFASAEEAWRALRARNHTYLGNDMVSMRVLP